MDEGEWWGNGSNCVPSVPMLRVPALQSWGHSVSLPSPRSLPSIWCCSAFISLPGVFQFVIKQLQFSNHPL